MEKPHLGPRKPGRTFNGDLMRGEGFHATASEPGKRKRPDSKAFGTSCSLGAGNFNDQLVGKRMTRKANAEPSGGGGGWKAMNEKLAASRAKAQSFNTPQALQAGRPHRVADASPYNAYGYDDDTSLRIAQVQPATGTSIFDPVLCELVYRWFCPPGGLVLDPFAGGSVRGIVASKLGRAYLGVDLSARQVEANEAQGAALCKDPRPRWFVGDAKDIAKIAKGTKADLVFSCPPYADLEVYSEDARDLSVMSHADFRKAYADIVAGACSLLKPDRFACFVIGDARGPDGLYYGLPALTLAAFEAAGLRLYNDAVLLTAIGSLPVRVGKQFTASRKLGKTHQNCLVFVKGDPVAATKAIGEVEFGEIEGVGVTNGGSPSTAAQFGEVL